MVMAENNSCPSVVIPLTAEITPRDLSKLSIPSTSLSGCAYYTGKPYSFDDLDWEAADLKKLLTDSGVTGADGGSYVLVKDTDFTVTEEDPLQMQSRQSLTLPARAIIREMRRYALRFRMPLRWRRR